ncbi:MAG: HepT-like ribonuclease domain-containing protein [Gemmatimonadota bacterium]|nr:HepT-like ribonuclease domain-containing protein [Gemmatimonadota bacterium]
MLDAIARLQRHIDDVEWEEFESSEITQDAVIRQLEILGEAAGRISRETCARFPNIPWPQITGLRHRLIHDYLGVDLRMIWKVASVEVERISGPLQSVLDELAKDEWPEAN